MKRIDERIDKAKEELKQAKKDAKGGSSARVDAKARQLEKMEADKRTKHELKNVALGTSRINYNDPRITVAWCKAMDVPITKPFNKSLLSKFTWAMSTVPDWRF
jgi:DNA topoisomerase-1